MRELTVRIRFTSPCLGTTHERGISAADARILLPRTPAGRVMFLSTWHNQNMRLAAKLLGRHQAEVDEILWDVAVDVSLLPEPAKWHRRHYKDGGGRARTATHEAIMPGQIAGLNCLVPAVINDDDFLRLMTIAGQYKGLSPFKPGEYGHFEVVSVRPRRAAVIPTTDMQVSVKETVVTE